MKRWIAWGVALVAVVAAAALWLPWWTAPESTYVFAGGELTDEGRQSLRGTEVAGSLGTWLVVLAAFASVVAAASGSASVARWWVAAGGVVMATVAVGIGWSWGLALGSAVTLAAGLVVLGVALVGRGRLLPVAVVLLAVPVWFVPDGEADLNPDRADPSAAGPLELLVAGTVERGPNQPPPRGGMSVLPPTSGQYALVTVDDGVGIALPEGILGLDDGRLTVRVRNEDTRSSMLGIVDGRLVTVGDEEVRITAPGAEPVVVTGVERTSSLSPAGTLLIATDSTVRRLDVASPPAGRTAADDLPTVPVPSLATVTGWVVEHPGTGRIVATDALLGASPFTAAPGDREWVPLAGGSDESCGLSSRATASFLHQVDAVAPASDDGWWLTDRQGSSTRLLSLSADGELRATRPVSIGAAAVAEDSDGSLLAVSRTGLWRLADPATGFDRLPEPRPDCAAHP